MGWLILAAACASPTAPPGPHLLPALVRVAGNEQTAVGGSALPVQLTVRAVAPSGAPRPGSVVRFSIIGGGGWVVDSLVTAGADGLARATWILGPATSVQRLQAIESSDVVEFAATATLAVPGTTMLGANGYIEYHVGDGPVILSAPHGGAWTPSEIPDRAGGTQVRDTNTEEMAHAISAALLLQTGQRPHMVVSRLRRTKLDPNRDVVEAAEAQPAAVRAWREYQHFLEVARATVGGTFSNGLLIDVHGHGHVVQRVEWGYLVTGAQLRGNDASLLPFAASTAMRARATSFPGGIVAVLRGPQSIGALMTARGYSGVPSPAIPAPLSSEAYWSGGYITARHGSRDGGSVDAVQMEMQFTGVRDTEGNRARYASALAQSITLFRAATP